MTLRQSALAGVAALLLVTCTSCNVAAFDADGNGTVTRQEFTNALIDFFCGEDEEPPAPTDGTPDDGSTPDDGGTTPDDGGTTP